MKSNPLYRELEAELTKKMRGEVRFDTFTKTLYSTDASNYQIEPVGVVIPRTVDDAEATVETAVRYGVPILPRGGGTSLAGQAVGHALVIDFSKYLSNIIEVDKERKTVRTEPGIYLEQLNRKLRPHGLKFGPDPSTARIATAGGAVGNNSTGAHSILYGMAGDNVEAATILTADNGLLELHELSENGPAAKAPGQNGALLDRLYKLREENAGIIKSKFPRHWRRASGYSLNYLTDNPFNPAKLLAGAEGTLGLATELTLRLVPIPSYTGLSILQFGDVRSAMEAVPLILEQNPSAIELIDSMLIRLTKAHAGYRKMLSFVDGEPEALLVVEFYGETGSEIRGKTRNLAALLGEKKIGCSTTCALTHKEQENVWGVRRAGLGLLMSKRDEYKPVTGIEDLSVPVNRLPEFVSDISDLFGRIGTRAAFYGHASAGCLHIRPLVNLKTEQGKSVMKELTEESLKLVLKYGGVLSGEHGDGLQRSYLNEKLFGPELYGAMRGLKAAFDLDGLFNPGKVVDPLPPDENLRYGNDSKSYEVDTYLDWSPDGGFSGAVEMCNGQGVCRKLGEGTMCPSYMATRDERDTTRARANALRAVLSGRLEKESLTGGDMHSVFDLCLSCKACKSECPSRVDVAKMKLEFMAHYNAENGVGLRDRILGNVHKMSRLASRAPGLSNFLLSNPVTRRIMSGIGIHPARTLPLLAGESFTDWFYGRQPSARDSGRKKVVYFHDTWAAFYHPETGRAAVRLLEEAGFEVVLAEKRACCGRPMLSKGIIEPAREMALCNTVTLAPYAREGIPVVGTEPSCILTFRDEYRDLLPHSADAKLLAENSYLLEEFLYGLSEAGTLDISWKEDVPPVLYHGHCHQRALSDMEAPLKLLSLSGCGVRETGAGCCGMAGSFGYESEHYEVSRAIGEDRLFPAVNEAPPETEIAVSGVSCRHQIEHFTGRKTRHIAEILAERVIGKRAL
ncbi:MAG: FAD-linked oxidase C-terminal domain-containing protein [Deltaproteobacteria bacterium]